MISLMHAMKTFVEDDNVVHDMYCPTATIMQSSHSKAHQICSFFFLLFSTNMHDKFDFHCIYEIFISKQINLVTYSVKCKCYCTD